MCRCSLLIVLRPLCNSCTIFLSWAKLLDSFLATGGLGAFVLVCFGHRLLGMWMGYYVGGSRVASCSVQEKHCSRATLSWFVLEGAVTDLGWRRSCQGEGHDELYDSGEAAGKPVPRARKVPAWSRADLLYPHRSSSQIAVFTAPTGICQPFLGATPDISGRCILPRALSQQEWAGTFSLFQKYIANCWAKIECVSKA